MKFNTKKLEAVLSVATFIASVVLLPSQFKDAKTAVNAAKKIKK